MFNGRHFGYLPCIKVIAFVDVLYCSQPLNQMTNWMCFNKRWFYGNEGLDLSSLCAEISAGRGRRTALCSLPFALSLPIFITLSLSILTSSSLFFSYQLATLSFSLSSPASVSYRFKSSLDVDALAPRYGGIGQAVTSAAPARDVHALAPQVPESLCYHQDGIVGQS